MDDLQWLEQWFLAQTDGVWEHGFGVRLESCDNPGWWLHVDLKGGKLSEDAVIRAEGEPPSPANGNVGSTSWMICEIKDGKFSGAGDPTKLRVILRCFREWTAAQANAVAPR